MNTIGEIGVSALSDSLQANPGLMVIDVRTVPEWEAMRIPGVKQFILFEGFDQHCSKITVAKDMPVYMICRTGRRSEIAAKHLASLGYSNTVNVVGGTVAWAQAGLPLESGPLIDRAPQSSTQ